MRPAACGRRVWTATAKTIAPESIWRSKLSVGYGQEWDLRMERPVAAGAKLERATDQSVQSAVAQALRKQIEASPVGAYLGSEAEILRRLGVSSPTLRQAARLLEQQQLLSVERGKGGGYFGRRPDGQATARAAAWHLESIGTPVWQVRQAALPLMIEAARLAAQSRDAEGRASFGAALAAMNALPADADAGAVLACDRKLVGEILRLAKNPAIDLFLGTTYRLGRLRERRQSAFEARPEWVTAWRKHVRRMGDAIAEGDPDLAALLAGRGGRLTAGWLEEMERLFPPSPSDVNRLWRPVEGSAPTTQATVEALQAAVFAVQPGAYLGSEEELASRFQVSRHTLRQAAVIMQHNGLLDIKRGVSGGYVGRRPDIDHVVRSVASYLEFNGGTLDHLIVASQCLTDEACRLAAASLDDAAREALRRAGEAMAHSGELQTDADPAKGLLRAETALMNCILSMAGSRPIELFVQSMYLYGGRIPQPVYGRPDRVALWRKARLRLVEAILESDQEAAVIISRRIAKLLIEWLH
jgi:GntR family transcriptional repressor for pyruvate dehydrogenase complex